MWRAGAVAICAALACAPVAAGADTILSATFAEPTTRYPHGVLGDAVEWGRLEIEVGATVGDGTGLFTGKRSLTYEIVLPEDRVFEDLAPRLWDITGDGAPEVVVVLSAQGLGAALVVLGLNAEARPVQIAGTPHIGQTNRWLAPIGAADFDGDGRIEVAYIDRPHLAKTLRVWEFDGTALRPDGDLAGLTNHRIGEDFISGGLRDCGAGPEMITADAGWRQVMATRMDGGVLTTRALGPFAGQESLTRALDCAG